MGAPLLSSQQADRAARLLTLLGVHDVDTWLDCARLFDDAGQLDLLVQTMPLPPVQAKLPCKVYDAVLQRLVRTSPHGLNRALRLFTLDLFSPSLLVSDLRQELSARSDSLAESSSDTGYRELT